MSVWSKVMTALRGSINEVGEAIADSQALRILDQEIRDADEELKQSRESLAEVMARQKVAEQQCTTLNDQIIEVENYALQALEQNDESLAIELAEKISALEKQLNSDQNTYQEYTENANKLRNATQLADENIKNLKFQVESVKATEDVQRAQAAVAQRHSDSNSRLAIAMDSLERIKEKQKLNNAKCNAVQEIAENHAEDTLNNRLEAAGIISDNLSSDAVLARLKNKLTLRIGSDGRPTL